MPAEDAIRLLIRSPHAPDSDAPITRTGGRPLLPPEIEWPRCRMCEDPLTFLAQARIEDADPRLGSGFVLAFGCASERGDSDCWAFDLLGNRSVFRVPPGAPAADPPEGTELRPAQAFSVQDFPVTEWHEDVLDAYSIARREVRELSGKLGGVAFWLASHPSGAFRDLDGRPIDAPHCRCQLDKKYRPKRGAICLRLLAQFEGVSLGRYNEGCTYLLLCPVCGQPAVEFDG